MMTRPTLFLTVGLPSTGKTTAARQLEIEHSALRLTKDEWVKALYSHENPPTAQDVIEGRLIEIGLRVLELGTNVVIDYGLWSRDERSALRQAAADRGASVEMRYFEVTPAEQRRRLDQRQAEAPHTTWPMSDEELAEWAATFDIPTPGELDGSEAMGGPPPDSRRGTSGVCIAGRRRSRLIPGSAAMNAHRQVSTDLSAADPVEARRTGPATGEGTEQLARWVGAVRRGADLFLGDAHGRRVNPGHAAEGRSRSRITSSDAVNMSVVRPRSVQRRLGIGGCGGRRTRPWTRR